MESFLKEFGEEIKELCPRQYGERLASVGFYKILNSKKKEGRGNVLASLKFRFSLFHFSIFILSFFLGARQLNRISLYFLKIKENTVKFLKRFARPVVVN